MFLFVGMFLISLASALEFDNVGTYNESTRTMTIDNLFGLGSRLASITLDSDLDHVVAAGYQKVAQFTVDNEGQYDDALRTMKFYDRKDDMKALTRAFDYRILTRVNYEVNDYGEECITLQNETKVCEIVIKGTHTEQREQWNKMSTQDLNQGVFVVGVFTNVEVGDVVEWVPTFYGIEIDEWAVWTQSLNLNISHYYKLDETSGAVIDSIENTNLTNTGASALAVGKIATAYNFTPTDFIGNFTIDWNSTGWSFCLWANTTTTGFRNILYSDSGTGAEARFRISDTNRLQWSSLNGVTIGNNGSVINDGAYHFLCATRSGLVETIFQDGVQIASATAGATIDEREVQLSGPLSSDSWIGNIDEVGVWNRTLTTDEISQLFNNDLGITFVNRTVILNAPAENTTTTNTTITFNCTADLPFGQNLSNISLYTNESGSFVAENTTSGLSGLNFTETWNRSYTDTRIIWSCESCNQAGSCAFAEENRTLIVDNTNPQITINAPTGLFDFNRVGGLQLLNWTVTDTNLDTCQFDYNGTNTTVNCNDDAVNITMEDNNFNLTFFVNDTGGNENSSFTSWNYRMFEKNIIFDSTLLVSEIGTYNLFFSSNGTLVSQPKLLFNSAETTGTLTNNGDETFNISATRTALSTDASASSFNFSVVVDSSTVTSNETNQTINPITLVNCSVGNVSSYLHIIFEDESLFTALNASVSSSIWNFFIDTEAAAQEFLFTNVPENESYDFCFTPSNVTYTVDIEFPYSSTGFPQRVFRENNIVLTNTTTNVTLFLLADAEGIFTRYIAINSLTGSAIAGVEVRVQKDIAGVPTTIAEGITDDTGLFTVFLNPDDLYTFTFTLEGFAVSTFSIRPSSPDIYQIAMIPTSVEGVANGTDVGTDLFFEILPTGLTLDQNTFFEFSFNVSRDDAVDNFSMSLSSKNATGTITSLFNGTNIGNGIITTSINTSLNVSISGVYTINVGNETFEIIRAWTIANTTLGDFSLDAWIDFGNDLAFNSLWWSLFRYIIILITLLTVAFGFYHVDPFDSSMGSLVAAIIVVWLFGTFEWLTIDTPLGSAIDNSIIPAMFTLITIGFLVWRYKSQ